MDKSEKRQMVIDFVVECRGSGHFLPYRDYEIIEKWIDFCQDFEKLVLVLEEELPVYFEKATHPPPLLAGVDRKVCHRLRENQF